MATIARYLGQLDWADRRAGRDYPTVSPLVRLELEAVYEVTSNAGGERMPCWLPPGDGGHGTAQPVANGQLLFRIDHVGAQTTRNATAALDKAQDLEGETRSVAWSLTSGTQ